LYDFLNIFAEKTGENWRFFSKTLLVYAKVGP
jgi:hypothetical protein